MHKQKHVKTPDQSGQADSVPHNERMNVGRDVWCPVSPSQNSQHHCHLHRALQAWLLQLTLLQPIKYSIKPSSTHPNFSRTCCRQGPKVFPYQSCSQTFTLA